ncbi:MAG TPA: MAPEG family protein [Steroidobacteraceae bacterium]|nr:MAPEG family protein [Steroidobacteraceae bacterium]
MLYVHLVILLALLELFLFAVAVSRARSVFGIKAPATTGHPVFDRTYRVQANTIEHLVIFVPSILFFAWYVGAYIAAALGVVFLVGRILYFRGYVKDPEARGPGAILTALPNALLLIGSIVGVIWALVQR